MTRTTYLIDLKSNPSGKESNSGKGGSYPVVPQVRNVIFSPIQVQNDDTEDNDDEIIKVPAEPAAKGSLRVPQWSASAQPLRTHFMMFHIQRCFMVSPNASYRLLHWGD